MAREDRKGSPEAPASTTHQAPHDDDAWASRLARKLRGIAARRAGWGDENICGGVRRREDAAAFGHGPNRLVFAKSILDADEADHRHEEGGRGEGDEDVKICGDGGHGETPLCPKSAPPGPVML